MNKFHAVNNETGSTYGCSEKTKDLADKIHEVIASHAASNNTAVIDIALALGWVYAFFVAQVAPKPAKKILESMLNVSASMRKNSA